MKTRDAARTLLGIAVLAVGVIALLETTGVIDVAWGQVIGQWWPLAIIAVGLVSLAANPRGWIGSAIVIVVGLVFLATTLDLVEFSLWQVFWPLVLIAIGLMIVLRAGAPRGASGKDTVSMLAILSGQEIRNTSTHFRGGSITALLGGAELDLREAGLAPEGATLSVFTFWAGADIRVPSAWRVDLTGLPILGGWDDKTQAPADAHAPVLRVNATCVMGGLDVKN